jgi:uncharacterized alkaline shock family protein YloU
MATLKNPNDVVTVAPGVILTIVQMAALNVEGVVAMSSLPGSMDRWLRRSSAHDGVRLSLEEGSSVRVDIYLLADASRSLYQTCRSVQEAVARTIKEYVGMDVIAVNVHIDDVEFPKLADRSE